MCRGVCACGRGYLICAGVCIKRMCLCGMLCVVYELLDKERLFEILIKELEIDKFILFQLKGHWTTSTSSPSFFFRKKLRFLYHQKRMHGK